MEDRYLTVTALNRYIKYKFDYDTNLKGIMIEGEISNFKRHARGHFYFTLKDSSSQISCMMFASRAALVNFEPKNGDKVYIKGDVQVYEQGGSYQIYVSSLKNAGIGDLYLKYEQLKKELQERGLFDQKYKKGLPKYPKVIGVITSDTGAVIHDIMTTTRRRYPLVKIILYPCLVQGEFAKDSIVTQIKKANNDKLCDVLIVGRGGGSLEDLWPFNELVVAEAIFNSIIPIISAVGHESDTTIADYVADKRAATPTAAAELATPNVLDIKEDLKNYNLSMTRLINNKLADVSKNLAQLDERLDSLSPIHKLSETKKHLDLFYKNLNLNMFNILTVEKSKLDKLSGNLNPYIKSLIESKTNKYQVLVSRLDNLSPLKIMDKGFSMVKSNDKVIRSVDDVKVNELIDVTLKDGVIKANVKEVLKNGR